jgi:hypothetical protein
MEPPMTRQDRNKTIERKADMDADKRPDEITEEWLAASGFRWRQLKQQPSKQWLLWLGASGFLQSYEDIGIEVAQDKPGAWFCWIRSDLAQMYGRFVHIRQIRTRNELILLVEALSGLPWKPENHIYGAVRTEEQALRIRMEEARPDRVLLHGSMKWTKAENDLTQGGALPEHLDEAERKKPELRGHDLDGKPHYWDNI